MRSSHLTALYRRAENLVEILGYLQQGDYGRFLLEVLHHVPGHAVEYRRATLRCARQVVASRPPPPSISFCWATADQLPEVAALSGQKLAVLRQRLAEKDRCYIAIDAAQGGRIVHSRWAHLGACHIHSLGYDLRLEPEEAYVYGGYTDRQLRCQGIASNSLAGIQQALQPGTRVPLYTFSEDWNRPATTHHRRSQFFPVTRVRYLALLGFGLSWELDVSGAPKNYRLVRPSTRSLPEV